MEVMGISQEDQWNVWRIVAAILYIGNITFKQNDKDEAYVADTSVSATAAYLVGIDTGTFDHVLTHRTISTGTAGRSARVSTYSSPHTAESAEYARDALAKAMYSRLFDWVVGSVNKAMGWRSGEGTISLSLLDIYGFEIFGKNGFEQLCINYVNEKLQQIFIELTLKSEQEEYREEGIAWENVEYFNNKVCCDLIESTSRPAGLFRILDDVCTMPMGSDDKFLQQAGEAYAGHAHFEARGQEREFVIRHYAGDVTYSVEGFCDKNRDLLFYDHIDMCGVSDNPLLVSLFPEALNTRDRDKKRPTTAGFKIKQSIADLVAELSKCKMHYIRCIKPNDTKSPMSFDSERVMHQVKYLGLLENTRIRRAGYAYRETYEKLFYRFRVCCPETWPKWSGGFDSGAEAIVRSVVDSNSSGGGSGSGGGAPYARGKTKLFIRKPETIFALEELRERTVQIYANRLQRFFLQFTLQNYYYTLHKAANDAIAGKKERRPYSLRLESASLKGDYLNYRDNFALKAVLQPYGHEKVAFTHAVSKHYTVLGPLSLTRLARLALVLTDVALYLIAVVANPDKEARKKKPFVYDLAQRYPLSDITGIDLSPYKDGFFALHAPPKDVLLELRRKTEFLALLLKHAPGVRINFTDKFALTDAPGKIHTVSFEKNPAGGDGAFKKNKVLVAEGQPPSSQPNLKPPPSIEMTTVGDYYEIQKKRGPVVRPTPGGGGGGGAGAGRGGAGSAASHHTPTPTPPPPRGGLRGARSGPLPTPNRGGAGLSSPRPPVGGRGGRGGGGTGAAPVVVSTRGGGAHPRPPARGGGGGGGAGPRGGAHPPIAPAKPAARGTGASSSSSSPAAAPAARGHALRGAASRGGGGGGLPTPRAKATAVPAAPAAATRGAAVRGGGGPGHARGGGAPPPRGGGRGALPPTPTPHAAAAAKVRRAKVLYDFKAEGGEEIDITEGGIVTITRSIGDWLEGDFNGKHGIFPTSYVEEF